MSPEEMRGIQHEKSRAKDIQRKGHQEAVASESHFFPRS